ncbi:hypothetical protein NP493_551g02001 [Ridgeia piscesae]|uniref:Uncharacterized protein n=1 Tax=Ridgeia piscesae TaxID=27915 RepID=A0AAD9KVT5_RIDPI|nr:hypothetical protein NP493_551g02001 [Ridgeia piscesae]
MCHGGSMSTTSGHILFSQLRVSLISATF